MEAFRDRSRLRPGRWSAFGAGQLCGVAGRSSSTGALVAAVLPTGGLLSSVVQPMVSVQRWALLLPDDVLRGQSGAVVVRGVGWDVRCWGLGCCPMVSVGLGWPGAAANWLRMQPMVVSCSLSQGLWLPPSGGLVQSWLTFISYPSQLCAGGRARCDLRVHSNPASVGGSISNQALLAELSGAG